ncbi:hypothetical protein CLF_105790 [Clonorchis sinensis]|uniref:ATP-binding cassette transporter n=1 Tax=Clonorchis sinensis TaxID=79923 RepID=G7YPG1_CLOSI|nr:hypothetical protein CLF_105790 [Clonorchis sinensis]
MPIQYLRRSTIAQQYRSELAQQLSTVNQYCGVDEAWQNVKEAMLAAFSAVCPTSPIRPQNHWISARSLSMIDARKSIPAGNASQTLPHWTSRTLRRQVIGPSSPTRGSRSLILLTFGERSCSIWNYCIIMHGLWAEKLNCKRRIFLIAGRLKHFNRQNLSAVIIDIQMEMLCSLFKLVGCRLQADASIRTHGESRHRQLKYAAPRFFYSLPFRAAPLAFILPSSHGFADG